MQRLWLGSAFGVCIPALWMTMAGHHTMAPLEAVVFGIAIFGAAFVLSWAAEVGQMDMSQALATALLALICVLPEYAIDLYFAWQAASDPQYGHYAAANMTGANRLLVGIGWPAIFLVSAWRSRGKPVHLERGHSTEIVFLGAATVYSFVLPLKRSLGIEDTAVFLLIFAAYAWRIARAAIHEPELVGPARLIGALRPAARRACVLGMFVFAALMIWFSAERFAEALIHSGREHGISEFLLVQWIAPLASEAPEFIVAILWALRGDVSAGLGALLSSKVNQWTLLIGTIPVAFSIALGRVGSLPLDGRQQHELLLTACQSLFAVAVLLNLRMSWYGATALFSLFLAQLVFEHIRLYVSAVYAALAVVVMVRDRKSLLPVLRAGIGRGP